VALDEFLEKMKVHNPRAYKWLGEEWKDIKKISDTMPEPVCLLFRAECCEEIGTIQ